MGLISNRRAQALVPAAVLDGLAHYGRASFEARASGQPIDQRFGWGFVAPVVTAAQGPTRDRVIQDLYETAATSDERDLSIFGAYSVLAEADDGDRDPRFLELCDASLEYMHTHRFSSGHLTRREADRWIELHGDLRSSFDHIVDVAVPQSGEGVLVDDLEVGGSKLLALTAPLPNGNAFYAERGTDARYIVFSERVRSADDPTRARCDESYLGSFESLESLLTAVGKMFGTPPYWADEQLASYFPSRRS